MGKRTGSRDPVELKGGFDGKQNKFGVAHHALFRPRLAGSDQDPADQNFHRFEPDETGGLKRLTCAFNLVVRRIQYRQAAPIF